ncbi:MAG: serine/threonine protein kinase [Planctomycetes bacterium]|nr:serine/threonine protein kinase [Planctomycetota bacterium]
MTFTYKWFEFLGKGSFGEVWKGVQVETGALVAVKLLHANQRAHFSRFLDEARTLQGLAGEPHVVRILDYNFDLDRPMIVLEFCDQGSLRSWVGKRPWRHVAGALRHAAYGLASVHGIGALHRDVKPDNLLIASLPVSNEVNIKVADFGVARCHQPFTGNMTYSLQGTDGYISPEVRRGDPFQPPADIFSLGITGIELITGRKNMASLSSAQIPVEFKNLLNAMCANNPAQRPSAQQLGSMLSEIEKMEEPLVEAEKSSSGAGWGLLALGLAVGVGLLALGASKK